MAFMDDWDLAQPSFPPNQNSRSATEQALHNFAAYLNKNGFWYICCFEKIKTRARHT